MCLGGVSVEGGRDHSISRYSPFVSVAHFVIRNSLPSTNRRMSPAAATAAESIAAGCAGRQPSADLGHGREVIQPPAKTLEGLVDRKGPGFPRHIAFHAKRVLASRPNRWSGRATP